MEMTIKALLIISFFIASIQDIRIREIPDGVHLLLLFAGALSVISGAVGWQDALLSFVVMAVLGIVLAYAGAIGGGDMKMLTAAALPLGLAKSVSTLLMAALLMGACLLALILLKKDWKKRTVPFAPFYSIGYVIIAINAVAL